MKIEIHNINRNDLAKKFADWGFKIGVEVGTHAGDYAEALCKVNKNLTLYTVDLFDLVYEDDYTGRIGQRKQRGLYKKVIERLLPYKCVVIKMLSIEALKLFEYEQLDFVYIDGSHHYDYVVTDIAMWGQKVRKGGVISCLLYTSPSPRDLSTSRMPSSA